MRLRKNGNYGCCACIGSAGTGLLPMFSAMQRQDGVALNLYANGTIDTQAPAGCPLRLDVETDYPYDGQVKVKIHFPVPEQFTLALQIPGWCRKAAVACADTVLSVQSGYTERCRVWQDGDTLSLDMEMPVQTYTQDGYVAFQRGPVILARDARLSSDVEEPVCVYIRPDGTVTADVHKTGPFRCALFCVVPTKEGGSLKLVDYASAGSTWDEVSKMTARIPLKKQPPTRRGVCTAIRRTHPV